jgi:hypothetical protein
MTVALVPDAHSRQPIAIRLNDELEEVQAKSTVHRRRLY